MNEVDVISYSYLWSGAEPEWHLRRLPPKIEAKVFFENGVTGKDVLKLKNVSSKYAEVQTGELLAKLKGEKFVSLDEIDANHVATLQRRCEQLGLELRLLEKGERYVIVNSIENTVLSIQDDEIYCEVKKRMLAAGVRILS